MEWAADPDLYPPYLRSRIRRKLGLGACAAYKAWRSAADGANKGKIGCVHGIRIDRRYELPDERARTYFFLIERASEIVDIRERWPILDINSTLRLSQKFLVNHPQHEIFPEPLVLDFLITEMGPAGLRHRAVSLQSRPDRLAVRERRLNQIQQQWCKEHDIDWTVADTSRLDRTVLDALRFLRAWYRLRYVPDAAQADSFAEGFLRRYKKNLVLDQLVESTRKTLRIGPDIALDLFRYCGWSHRIPVSLTARISKNCPLVLQKVDNGC